MKKLLYILVFALSAISLAQNNELFDQANALYNEGKFSDAINKYEAIIKNGQHSAELYYNLGNAHYKLNNIAPSIYYYEKALQLKPNDKEILNNIAYAKNMTIDDIEAVPKLGLSRFLNKAINTLSFDNWATLSIIFVVGFVLLFVTYFFTFSTSKKRLAFVSGLGSLLIGLICLSFAFKKQNLDKNNNPAIVFAKETEVKSEPNLGSTEAFVLHEGTKVQVLDTINNWKKIKLADGKTGWIISGDIKLLNTF